MLLLLHICRPRCPTLCADVVFTCLVKWRAAKALGNSKYHLGILARICGQGFSMLSVKHSVEAATLLFTPQQRPLSLMQINMC